MITLPSRRAALALVFASQCLVLGWMIADRVILLRTGREIVLDAEPVDPRSLFRGDYVTLRYPAAQVPLGALAGTDDRSARALFVVLAQNADGQWRTVRASSKRPDAVAQGEVMLQGRLIDAGRSARVSFGIESYFLPEDTGKPIESAIATKRVQVRVAVGADGRAAIKSLLIDGNPLAQEGLL